MQKYVRHFQFMAHSYLTGITFIFKYSCKMMNNKTEEIGLVTSTSWLHIFDIFFPFPGCPNMPLPVEFHTTTLVTLLLRLRQVTTRPLASSPMWPSAVLTASPRRPHWPPMARTTLPRQLLRGKPWWMVPVVVPPPLPRTRPLGGAAPLVHVPPRSPANHRQLRA